MRIGTIGWVGAVAGVLGMLGSELRAVEIYWSGAGGGSAWDARSGNYSNWSTRSDRATSRQAILLPDPADTINFTITGGGTAQILDLQTYPQGIAKVVFNDQATKPMTILNSTFYIAPAVTGAVGLVVTAGSASHEFQSNVGLSKPQTWQIDAPTTPDANAMKISGVITGNSAYSLTKTGGGTLIFKSGNTYVGPTYIQQGTLRVENTKGLANGTGTLTIQTDGTLDGTGIVGPMSLSGTLSAGARDKAGLLKTGNQTWHDGARLSVDLLTMPDNGIAGVGWDKVQSNGTVDFGLTGQWIIDVQSLLANGVAGSLSGFDPSAAASWSILSATQLTHFDATRFTIQSTRFANDLQEGEFSVRAQDNTVYLDFTPVAATPEPATLAAWSGAMLWMLQRRRRG